MACSVVLGVIVDGGTASDLFLVAFCDVAVAGTWSVPVESPVGVELKGEDPGTTSSGLIISPSTYLVAVFSPDNSVVIVAVFFLIFSFPASGLLELSLLDELLLLHVLSSTTTQTNPRLSSDFFSSSFIRFSLHFLLYKQIMYERKKKSDG